MRWTLGWNFIIIPVFSEDPSATDVASLSGEDIYDATNPDMVEAVRPIIPTLQPKSVLAPRVHMTSSYYVYHYKIYMQLLFALFADLFLKLSGQKPM